MNVEVVYLVPPVRATGAARCDGGAVDVEYEVLLRIRGDRMGAGAWRRFTAPGFPDQHGNSPAADSWARACSDAAWLLAMYPGGIPLGIDVDRLVETYRRWSRGAIDYAPALAASDG